MEESWRHCCGSWTYFDYARYYVSKHFELQGAVTEYAEGIHKHSA
jgi:sarcosine oxidase delta subunit